MGNVSGDRAVVPLQPSPTAGQLSSSGVGLAECSARSDKEDHHSATAKDQSPGKWNKILWYAVESNEEGRCDRAIQALESGADPNHRQKCATGSGAESCERTPLHVASRKGDLKMVQLLIQRRAQVQCDRDTTTPLMAAIDHHHAAVVRLLVQKQAQVFDDKVIDLLFGSNYVGTIEAVTDGLLSAKEEDPEGFKKKYLKGLMKHWKQFLKTSSDAMLSIIHVIFQETSLSLHCVDMEGSEGLRLVNHALIPEDRNINVAVGPDLYHFNLTLERATPSWVDRTCSGRPSKIVVQATRATDDYGDQLMKRRIGKLLDGLLQKPDVDDIGYAVIHPLLANLRGNIQKQVPIKIYRSTIPDLHLRPELFLIIAKQDQDDNVYKDPAIQALLQFSHQRIAWALHRRLIGNLCLLGLFVKMSVKINNNDEVRFDMQSFTDGASLVLLSGIILYNIVREIFQIAGFALLQKAGTYWRDFWNWLELGSLVMIFAVGWGLVTSYESFVNPEKEAYVWWRALLSVVSFFNWLRVFSILRVQRWAGPTILPILHGFENLMPFLAVTSCPLIGMFHAYYCFGVYKEDVWRTFSIVYRLGIVGDFDLEEMEDVDGHYVPETNDGVSQFTYMQPDKGPWWLVLRIFLIACSMILTVAIMNIFIGVLSESYEDARERREAIFWKTRANVLAEEVAYETAWERCCRSKQKEGLFSEQGDLDFSEEDLLDPQLNYLWYCRHVEGGSAQSNSPKEAATQDDLMQLKGHLQSTYGGILEELKRVSATAESALQCALSLKPQEQHTHQVDPDVEGLKAKIRDIMKMLEHGRNSGQIASPLEANLRSMLEQAFAHVVKGLDAAAVKELTKPWTMVSQVPDKLSATTLNSEVRQAARKEIAQAQPVSSPDVEPWLIDKLQDVVLGLEKENACLRQDMVQLEADVQIVKGQSSPQGSGQSR